MNNINPYLRSVAHYNWIFENSYMVMAYYMRIFALRKHSSVVILENDRYELPPESILIFRPGVLYDIRNKHSDCLIDLYCCNFDLTHEHCNDSVFHVPVAEKHFRPEYVRDCYSAYDNPDLQILSKPVILRSCPELCENVKNIYDEICDNSTYSLEICSGLLKYTILKALKLASSLTAGRSIPQKNIAEKTMIYIREHFNEPINEKDIAAAMNFHPYYLSRLIKQYYGTTPYRYLLKCRCDYGVMLLTSTSLPISEIAEMCCFSSQAHFSSIIRREYNKTPSEIRKYHSEDFGGAV